MFINFTINFVYYLCYFHSLEGRSTVCYLSKTKNLTPLFSKEEHVFVGITNKPESFGEDMCIWRLQGYLVLSNWVQNSTEIAHVMFPSRSHNICDHVTRLFDLIRRNKCFYCISLSVNVTSANEVQLEMMWGCDCVAIMISSTVFFKRETQISFV